APRFTAQTPPPSLISPLSLHDALPICCRDSRAPVGAPWPIASPYAARAPVAQPQSRRARYRSARSAPAAHAAASSRAPADAAPRSEEHTSELQSQSNLVCRLLLEKKNN